MKIYTKQGDGGLTSLVDGSKVTKAELRIETYGNVDELNSNVGVLIAHLDSLPEFAAEVLDLKQIQIWLFHLGSQLACSDPQLAQKLPTINDSNLLSLENWIDKLDAELPQLRNFILPGGHIGSAQAHICRTVSRRAERSCVALAQQNSLTFPVIPFLNRISDYFFILARAINHRLGIASLEWAP